MKPPLRAAHLAVPLLTMLLTASAAAQTQLPGGGARVPPPVAEPTPSTAAPASEPDVPIRRNGEVEILVTGSRIPRKDLTTAAPIAVIDRQDIQASGLVSIGDILQSLPAQSNAINTQFNSNGNGATRINLRGLGPARTLVLFNGRRFVPSGDGADASVDLNSIPSSAIERVEVLKDGASAVYGSDAIAGVVNLITRKRMDGLEVAGYAGATSHSDGTVWDVSATAGASAEKGSFLITGDYYTQKPIFAGDRDFSRLPYYLDATQPAGKQLQTNGSVSTEASVFVIPACRPRTPPGVACAGRTLAGASPLYNQLMTRFPTATRFIRDPHADSTTAACGPGDGNCWRPFAGNAVPPNGDGYNIQLSKYLVTPQQRLSLFSSGQVNMSASARAFFEGSYVNRRSDQQLTPAALGTDSENLTVSAASVYNPFGRDFQFGPGTDPSLNGWVRRRLTELGNQRIAQDIDTFRLVAGVDGTLPKETGPLKGWFWEASVNHGRTEGTVVKQGSLKRSGLRDALGPSFTDSTGPHCGTPGQVIAGCVPLNLFGVAGGPDQISPDQIQSLTFTGTLRAINQLTSAQFNTSGELFKLFADRPVGLAAGYEYRIVSGESIPDPITVAGDTTGNKGQITRGHYFVNEAFGELSIPIASALPLIDDLEATAALRYFNYSDFGSDITYKLGARWRVVRDVTLRGTYSTGFRAPSISDLYLGQADSSAEVRDPCRGPIEGAQAANCGAAANNGDTSTSLRTRIGGNPALQPETAKIYTAGIVLEPSFLRNLTLTVDYYNITVHQSIGQIGAAVILDGCYPANPSNTPRPEFCSLIQRDPVSQRIVNIIDTTENVGQDQTSGIDISIRYAIPTDFGRFGLLIDATWLKNFTRTLASGTVVQARGTYDLGLYPAWKGLGSVRYGYRGFGAGLNAHFIGSFHECATPDGLFTGGGLCYADTTYTRQIDAYSTFDLFASYAFPTTFFGRTTLAAGVNNVFDKQPPNVYTADNLNGTSDPSAYDFRGRFFYARLTHAF